MSLRCKLYDQDLLSIFRELEDLENSEKMNGDLEAGSDHYVKKYNKLMKQKKKVGFDKMKKKRVNLKTIHLPASWSTSKISSWR